MTKIKLHNPELADNSTFKNLVIESLSTDPTLVGTSAVGRLWFNNAEKTFKGAFLDTDGTSIEIKPIGIDNSADVAENAANIATNTADIQAIQNSTEILATDIATNTTNIATNASNISVLETEMTATQTGAGLNSDGTFTADTTTNYLSTATSLTNADKLLDTQLKITNDGLAQELLDRASADTALDERVNTVSNNIGDLTTINLTDASDKSNIVAAINKVLDVQSTKLDADDAVPIIVSYTGLLSALTTDTQNSLVDAINELDQETNTNTASIATNAADISALEANLTTNYLDKTTTTEQVVNANTTFTGNLNIQGNLVVSGTSTTIETENLKVADNIITLNNGIGDIDPTEDAGFEVDRGTAGITKILNWNETLDQVEIQEDGVLRKVASVNYVDAEIATNAGDIDALTARVTDTEAATATNTTNIATNTSNISALETEMTATQASSGLESDGTYLADETTNYLTNSTGLKESDKLLDAQIKLNADGLAQEVIDRSTADSALDNRITDLETNVGSNIGDLTTLTTDAKDNLVNAVNEVDAQTNTNAIDIATEITDRVAADTIIKSELDATQAGAGLGTDGTYTADALTNYLTEATDLKDADKKLDAELKTTNDNVAAIDTRVTNLETAVTGNIGDLTTLTTDEKDTLVGAINEVDSHIDAEVTNRITADTTLQTNITSEENARKSADSALDTRIDNVNTAVGIAGDTYTADSTTTYLTNATSLTDADKTLDTVIKTNIDNLAAQTATNGTNLVGYEGYVESDTNIVNPTIEIAAGTLKDSLDDIASSVNLRIHEIENKHVKGEVADADKSDTYTIAHNLDTTFVDVSVQVYDADEDVWRFDLVVVEVIDANTVKISLASGTEEQIRYVIQGY